jgi:hypothetical protein
MPNCWAFLGEDEEGKSKAKEPYPAHEPHGALLNYVIGATRRWSVGNVTTAVDVTIGLVVELHSTEKVISCAKLKLKT